MGTTFYIISQTAGRYAVLDKFYAGAYLKAEEPQHFFRAMQEARNDAGIWRNWEVIEAFKVAAFVNSYGALGPVEIVSEYSFCPYEKEGWQEVLDDPHVPRSEYAKADISGVCAPSRIVVNTPHGEVYLDVLKEGVNTFSFMSGVRVDHLHSLKKSENPDE